MARVIRCISNLNLNLLSSSITRSFVHNRACTIYTDATLGLTDYQSARQMFLNRYEVGGRAFRSKMENALKQETVLVFTEDLKAIVHLVEKNPEDISLLKRMLEKYNSQNSELRFGSFKFGPIVMRALYYLNEPELAKELFMKPEFEKFFSQVTSYMLLLDLLLENGRHEEIREVYDIIKTKHVDGKPYSKLVVNIVALSCYQENTPEALAYCLQLCNDLSEKDIIPLRKCLVAVGALALKQNKPELALEISSQNLSPEYISTKCLRIFAQAALDKVDDIAYSFQTALCRNFPQKNQYFKDIIPHMTNLFERMNISEDAEIRRLFTSIQNQGYINDMTLDEHLARPIEILRKRERVPTYSDQGWGSREIRSSNDGQNRINLYGNQANRFNQR